jgi:hypothetical protein
MPSTPWSRPTSPRRGASSPSKARTGEAQSFTAFVLGCLGRALDADRTMHALRNWRNQLVLFDEAGFRRVARELWHGAVEAGRAGQCPGRPVVRRSRGERAGASGRAIPPIPTPPPGAPTCRAWDCPSGGPSRPGGSTRPWRLPAPACRSPSRPSALCRPTAV